MNSRTKKTTRKPTSKRTRKTMDIGRDPKTGRFVSKKNVQPGQKVERIKRKPRGPGKVKEVINE